MKTIRLLCQLEPGEFINLLGDSIVMIQESRLATEKEREDNWFIIDDCPSCRRLTWFIAYTTGKTNLTLILNPHTSVPI